MCGWSLAWAEPCVGGASCGRSLIWAEPRVGGASEQRSVLLMSPVRKMVCSPRENVPGRTSISWVCTGPTSFIIHTHMVRGVGGTPAPQASDSQASAPQLSCRRSPLLFCVNVNSWRRPQMPSLRGSWYSWEPSYLILEGELRGQPSWGSRVSSSFPGSSGGPRWASHGRKPHRKQVQLRLAGGTRAAGHGACGSEPLIGGGPPRKLPPKRAAPNPACRHTEQGPPQPPCPDTQEHTYLCPCSGHVTSPCPI